MFLSKPRKTLPVFAIAYVSSTLYDAFPLFLSPKEIIWASSVRTFLLLKTLLGSDRQGTNLSANGTWAQRRRTGAIAKASPHGHDEGEGDGLLKRRRQGMAINLDSREHPWLVREGRAIPRVKLSGSGQGDRGTVGNAAP